MHSNFEVVSVNDEGFDPQNRPNRYYCQLMRNAMESEVLRWKTPMRKIHVQLNFR